MSSGPNEVVCNRCDPRLNRCWKCSHRGPWQIAMAPDHLEARCEHCRAIYDIGHSPRGFDPDLEPAADA